MGNMTTASVSSPVHEYFDASFIPPSPLTPTPSVSWIWRGADSSKKEPAVHESWDSAGSQQAEISPASAWTVCMLLLHGEPFPPFRSCVIDLAMTRRHRAGPLAVTPSSEKSWQSGDARL